MLDTRLETAIPQHIRAVAEQVFHALTWGALKLQRSFRDALEEVRNGIEPVSRAPASYISLWTVCGGLGQDTSREVTSCAKLLSTQGITTTPLFLPPTKARVGNCRGVHSLSSLFRSPEDSATSSQDKQGSHLPSCPSWSPESRYDLHNVSAKPTPTERADKTRNCVVALESFHFDTSSIPPLELPVNPAVTIAAVPQDNMMFGTKLPICLVCHCDQCTMARR